MFPLRLSEGCAKRGKVRESSSAPILLLLVVGLLASCRSRADAPATNPTGATETAAAFLTATPPLPAQFPVLPTQDTGSLVAGAPHVIALGNGLTWTECVLPYRDYSHVKSDTELISNCLNMDFPRWNDSDRNKYGERILGVNGDDLQLAIGNDLYETRHTQSGARDYALLKNGTVIAKATAYFFTFDPNRNLGNLGGKLVWEIISDPPAVIVDGVDINREYQLEGSFFPYEINDKLILIARKDGKYRVMFDGKAIGAEFDEISMAYCCAKLSVSYGNGQYWFLGRRDGVQYVVAIH